MAKRKKISKQILDSIGDIDVVFVIDSTGSMGSYIAEAREHVVKVATKIAKQGGNSFRFGIVAYRDHPPQDTSFVTQVFDFMNLDQLQSVLGTLSANGGGDLPEAVWDGVAEAIKLSWRDKSDRMIYLVGDCPPHGHTKGFDGFPQGCPCGITDKHLVDSLLGAGIELNAFSIANSPETTAAFKLLADPTHGEVVVGDKPEEMTISYTSTFSAHSVSTSDSAKVLTAMNSIGSSYTAAATSLGWDEKKSKNIASHLTRRGILNKEDVETKDTTGDTNKEV